MGKTKILIVEDEAIVAEEIKTSLEVLGYSVTSIVKTGEAAVQKAQQDRPDVILMDIRLKGQMDGIEAAERIRSRFGNPVIFVTAYADEEKLNRAKPALPFGYLLKPIQDRDLKVTIEIALYAAKVDAERKQAEEALRESEERLRTITDTALDSIFCKDINQRYTFVNPSMIQLMGCTEADLIGKVPEEVFDKEAAAIVTEVDERTLNSENISEVRSLSIAEKSYTFHTIQVPLRDSDGNITGISGIVRDITEQKRTEEELQKAHDHLEMRVEERTAELANVNRNLKEEIIQRKYAWDKLKQKEKELKNKTIELRETNTALNVLLKRRQIDKEEVEEKVVSNVKALIVPYVKKLKKTKPTPKQDVYLNILQSNIEDILSPFLRNLAVRYSGLTPKEIEVGNLVREGRNTKEIAELMDTTKRAVEFHRHSLREKLGLKNTKANLRAYLISLP